MAEDQEPKKVEEKPKQESTESKENGEKTPEGPPVKEMRSIVLTGFGGLKTVKIQKKPEPEVAEGEVLIRVKAWYQEPKKVEEKPKQESTESKENGEKTPEGPPVKEMRSIVLTGFGGLKTVKIQKKPEPEVAEGEVLIRVKAWSFDLLFFSFFVVMAEDQEPKKVEEKPKQESTESKENGEKTPEGPPVKEMRSIVLTGFGGLKTVKIQKKPEPEVAEGEVGDRVVALPECKAWAELVSVPVQYVFLLPSDLSYQEGAALTMNYILAYVLLFDMAGLAPGKSVLLHSAGGGVGLAVAQLCKTVADVKLFGIASKSKHEALSASIEHLLERGTDYASEVRKIAPEGVDVVLDCIYGEECNRGYSLLKPLGKYILYGSSNVVTGETKSIFSVAKSWWQVDKVSPIKLFDENKTLGGFNLRHFLHHQNGSATIHSVYDKVIALWKKGSIKPVIDSTWALEDVHEGMQKMHERKNVGKIVLDPSLEPKPKPATPAKEKGKKGDKEKDKEDKEKKNKEEEANGTSASPDTKEAKEKESS
ncbi:synaptic vesicle membrane protein VAT-1 homolog-like [Diaphorina citri]|uniref:Synaptic vesicle membrane protein VAT-1 homolog-like n=1 Tax=Diaphorina citri TaxID=121845 RepID=A0A3Q0JG99_DIACI|nr:synaptic vesicle membrane protein VAT-1 homolog-like [Diaphorina citri]